MVVIERQDSGPGGIAILGLALSLMATRSGSRIMILPLARPKNRNGPVPVVNISASKASNIAHAAGSLGRLRTARIYDRLLNQQVIVCLRISERRIGHVPVVLSNALENTIRALAAILTDRVWANTMRSHINLRNDLRNDLPLKHLGDRR